ncbi:protein of unknown function [Georgfuchsia toluolica]|uniref:Uncharacterized protein n=1 Tax=Georgfuchsia toluolica TaxID=424218 RepID=A0A916N267_9PROT|nr:protein of unknown function [Georgfuchsia toluolica]
MASHAADFLSHAWLMRDFGDIRMAFYTLTLAVHTALKFTLPHVQRAHLAVGSRRCKPFFAMATQAKLARKIVRHRFGRLFIAAICRQHWHHSASSKCQ